MSATDISVETLKKSLAANGLSQWGTKEQMLHRLLTGGTDKKKPGPKPKGDVPKKKKEKATSGLKTATDGEEAAFVAAERPRIIAQGIIDPTAIEDELKRRWTSIKKSKQTATAAASGKGVVKLPVPLDAKQMAAMNLVFISNEVSPMTGSMLHVYGPKGATLSPCIAPAAGAKVKKADRTPGKKSKREDADEEEDDSDGDNDDGDDMSWACEVAAMRLLKKCRKETLVALCNDFGIPTSGNKDKLAEDAAEQMHYETDNSDDEDDDEDDGK